MSRKDDFLHYEEEFFSKDKKDSRKERKAASNKDRSKYKKSDQDQLKKQMPTSLSEEEEKMPRGRVLAIIPEGILVDAETQVVLCQLKGSLKKEKNRMKNLVAVGDFVRFTVKGEKEGTIAKIEERTSILSRADNLSRNKEQLIAVNIDQVLITVSVLFPSFKVSLIDRYIIAAQKGGMEPVIVINKIDLFDSPPPRNSSRTVGRRKSPCRRVFTGLQKVELYDHPHQRKDRSWHRRTQRSHAQQNLRIFRTVWCRKILLDQPGYRARPQNRRHRATHPKRIPHHHNHPSGSTPGGRILYRHPWD